MQRFFVVKNTWSKPVRSVTGVLEGCPLSVVMMAIVTWAITNVVANKFPGKTLLMTGPYGIMILRTSWLRYALSKNLRTSWV